MSDNVRGLLWGLLAMVLFALVLALVKTASASYHVLQILFFRQVMVFLSTLPQIAGNFPHSMRTDQPGWHTLRIFGALTGLVCSVYAVALLPLTNAITLMFAQVFFTAILAAWLLREQVGPRRVAAIFVGFIGVVVAMRPGTESLFDAASLLAIGSALGAAFAVVSVRRLSQTESTATLLAYQSVFVGAAVALPLPWIWVTPTIPDTLLLLTLGAVAVVAQWVGIQALRLGEASVVSNLEYTKLVWGAILGWLLFREIPDQWTLAGAAIIVSAALYIFHRERRTTRP
ncbi:MAG: DMT family transporter [Pseudomonadota bacterium]